MRYLHEFVLYMYSGDSFFIGASLTAQRMITFSKLPRRIFWNLFENVSYEILLF